MKDERPLDGLKVINFQSSHGHLEIIFEKLAILFGWLYLLCFVGIGLGVILRGFIEALPDLLIGLAFLLVIVICCNIGYLTEKVTTHHPYGENPIRCKAMLEKISGPINFSTSHLWCEQAIHQK